MPIEHDRNIAVVWLHSSVPAKAVRYLVSGAGCVVCVYTCTSAGISVDLQARVFNRSAGYDISVDLQAMLVTLTAIEQTVTWVSHGHHCCGAASSAFQDVVPSVWVLVGISTDIVKTCPAESADQ